MSKTYIPVETQQIVRNRAENRCEYCLSPQAFISSKLEIEHIIPECRNGSSEDNNLCLSCRSCNGSKLNKTEGIDETDGSKYRFYNPRTDVWSKHFRWSEDRLDIIGITEIGKVTVKELKLNSLLMRTARSHWRVGGWTPTNLNVI